MILHDHKLIFIHVPKCAGRSVCDVFHQRFDHFTFHYYYKEYTKFIRMYETFSIVRNPYDRLVSIYHYIKEHRRHSTEPIAVKGASFKWWLTMNIMKYQGDFTYTSPEGERAGDGDIGSSFFFSPQWRRVSSPDGAMVNKVFYFERLHEVEQFLNSKVGVHITLPHKNSSVHKPWREYYDSELIELCRMFRPIQEDCNKLGYELL